MTEKKYEELLLKNPKYDSQWISMASKILALENPKYDEGYLSKFNAEQLMHIKEAADKNIDIEFADTLNATQMQLLLVAAENNIDKKYIDILNNPEIPYAVSNYVVKGLIDGYEDMINYIDYDPEQVYEIYCGFVNNVDVSLYTNIRFSSFDMGLIRHALEIGKNVKITEDGLFIS